MDLATQKPQKLHDHISELRKRLVKSVAVFLVGAVTAYIFKGALLILLQRPLHETLYYTSPAGGFNFVMKICFVIGLAPAIPVIVYNLIHFLKPAFRKTVKASVIYLVTFISVCLAISGAAFAFLVVVPISLHFFGGFSTSGIKPLISAGDYLSFVLNCILSFMVISQLPIIVLFIDHIKPLKPKKLLHYERHVIVGSLVIALLLPFTYDPLTQFLIALPIILLYNLSIVFVLISHRSKSSATRKSHKPIEQTWHNPVPAKPLLATPRDLRPHAVPITNQAIYKKTVITKPHSSNLINDFARPHRPVVRRNIAIENRRQAIIEIPRARFLDLRPESEFSTN